MRERREATSPPPLFKAPPKGHARPVAEPDPASDPVAEPPAEEGVTAGAGRPPLPTMSAVDAAEAAAHPGTEVAAEVVVQTTPTDTDTVADTEATSGSTPDPVAEETADLASAEQAPAAASVSSPSSVVEADTHAPALVLRGVTKTYGGNDAVAEIDLTVPRGSFYGIVGPNGAGKTTTLSMIAGLLRPDGGTIEVCGIDLAKKPRKAKQLMGVLPDRLHTFDRLTGRQLLYYFGVLRGLKPAIVARRIGDLARAFELSDALGRVVADYSAGMTKKIMLAGALIHSPRVLVLDEPFEAVDPVSSATILDILSEYVAHGGTVVLSSHGMDLIETVCSRVAVIVTGQAIAEGTVEEVKGDATLEQRFVELSGAGNLEGLEWLHTSSD